MSNPQQPDTATAQAATTDRQVNATEQRNIVLYTFALPVAFLCLLAGLIGGALLVSTTLDKTVPVSIANNQPLKVSTTDRQDPCRPTPEILQSLNRIKAQIALLGFDDATCIYATGSNATPGEMTATVKIPKIDYVYDSKTGSNKQVRSTVIGWVWFTLTYVNGNPTVDLKCISHSRDGFALLHPCDDPNIPLRGMK